LTDWDDLFSRWKARSGKKAIATRIRSLLQSADATDVGWFAEALRDKKKQGFVGKVLDHANYLIPLDLVPPIVRVAVYEHSPGRLPWFVRPCLRTVGRRKFCELLLDYLENGTSHEKYGAANALYWTQYIRLHGEEAFPEEPMKDVLQRRDSLLLREFVANEDVEMRRTIILSLNLAISAFPKEMKPLVLQALEIARTHPDQSIRQRGGRVHWMDGASRQWSERQGDIPAKSRNLDKPSSRNRRRYFL
jgi:hypothetical protein